MPLPGPRVSYHYGFEKPVNIEIWQSAIQKLVNGELPRSFDILWMDSAWHAKSGNTELAPLLLCVALEQGAEYAFYKFWKQKGCGKFSRKKVMKGDGPADFLSKDAERIFGSSFEKDYPNEFKLIKSLWILRGKVAHGFQAVEHIGKNEKRFNLQRFNEFFNATRYALDWLEKLN